MKRKITDGQFGSAARLTQRLATFLGLTALSITAVVAFLTMDTRAPGPTPLEHECHLFGYAFGPASGSAETFELLCQQLYDKTLEARAGSDDRDPPLRDSPSRDGWGFSYFFAPEHPGLERPIFIKSGAAASDDTLRWSQAIDEIAGFGLSDESVVIGHVRKSSYGPDNGALLNPHPFADTLGGRWWTFAHNGHMVPDTLLTWIPEEFLERHPLNFVPIEVDSEVLFRYCQYEIEQHDGCVREGLLAAFGHVRDYYSTFVFNICMTDGDTLWAAHTHNTFPFYYGANEDSSAWWASTASPVAEPVEMIQHHLYWFAGDGWGEAGYE